MFGGQKRAWALSCIPAGGRPSTSRRRSKARLCGSPTDLRRPLHSLQVAFPQAAVPQGDGPLGADVLTSDPVLELVYKASPGLLVCCRWNVGAVPAVGFSRWLNVLRAADLSVGSFVIPHVSAAAHRAEQVDAEAYESYKSVWLCGWPLQAGLLPLKDLRSVSVCLDDQVSWLAAARSAGIPGSRCSSRFALILWLPYEALYPSIHFIFPLSPFNTCRR